ncbi:AAA family ATPase [Cellulomonas sp. ATA003]|uniref:AAA family ATPase n=1 Tax=Cellulomonas sp. ATA003 TaxID=3073064 RepID=UPI0028739DC5|nr:AAA family ATPase [Cellulomonas sp. ATA003]WNB85454.1 AAA family ATPase [Cellulomonas sp. ATA003]
MTTVLVTGMSGVGKSTVLAELARRGHRVVDTDDGDWIHLVARGDGTPPEPLWREDRIAALLDGHTDGALFVAGTVMNQGRFRSRFDAVVLLSAPLEVMLRRIADRDGNDFGKTAVERERIVADTAEVEPLLRAGATVEIDTRAPLGEVADRLETVARGR